MDFIIIDMFHVQGHVLPHIGITAQHKKVVELFDKLDKNGYNIVYLTARYAIH